MFCRDVERNYAKDADTCARMHTVSQVVQDWPTSDFVGGNALSALLALPDVAVFRLQVRPPNPQL
jgi:hypothetical protein